MLVIDVKLAASNPVGAGTGIGSMPANGLVKVTGALRLLYILSYYTLKGI